MLLGSAATQDVFGGHRREEGSDSMSDIWTEIETECPEWFHSIELEPGRFTPGRKTPAVLDWELAQLRLPDLHGKSVLDIGAYDGFFSFAAEKLGASRVVALDHYMWSTDMASYMSDWRETKRTGQPLPAPHESRHWRPRELPGRKPFDLARRALGSHVEPVVGDFMTMDLAALGQFDVVLFLGVLYHLEDPLGAVRRLRSVTAPGGLAIIETESMEIPLLGSRAVCEFFPGQELNNDPSNWWSPNAGAIAGMCRAAGFREAVAFKIRNPSLRARIRKSVPVTYLRGCLRGKFGLPVMRGRVFAHARG
jgi:tRNA (mo5U34)-methyltransferase